MTPPEIASKYHVNVGKVLGWIRRGELQATNIASRSNGQPRWFVSPEALEMFELRRSSQPTPKLAKRRRVRDLTVKEFFK